jgi:hypothetical protein
LKATTLYLCGIWSHDSWLRRRRRYLFFGQTLIPGFWTNFHPKTIDVYIFEEMDNNNPDFKAF